MIDVVVGDPYLIWRDNIVLRLDGYDASQTCTALGSLAVTDLYADAWRFLPTVPGTWSFRLQSGGVSKDFQLRAVDTLAPTGAAKNILFVGDSGTFNGGQANGFIQRMKDRWPARIACLGTRGTAPYKHDGDGGSSWSIWATQDPRSVMRSGGVINIPNYLTTIGATPALVIWNLGFNDVASLPSSGTALEDAITTIFDTQLDALLNAWRVAAPATKHVLGTCWPGNPRASAWDLQFGGLLTRDQFRAKMHRWYERLIERYAGRLLVDSVDVVQTHLYMDPIRSYPEIDTAHFDTITGHLYVERCIAGWVAAHWDDF